MKTTHLLLSIPLALLVVSGCTSDELQEKPQTNEKGNMPFVLAVIWI